MNLTAQVIPARNSGTTFTQDNCQFAVESKTTVCHIEMIQSDDPRVSDPCMREAVNAEARDLLNRDTFKAVLREEILAVQMC